MIKSHFDLEYFDSKYKSEQAVLELVDDNQRLLFYVYIRALLDSVHANKRISSSANEWFLSNAKQPPSKAKDKINFIWCVEQFTPDPKALVKKTRRFVKMNKKVRIRILRKFNYFTTSSL